jgi:DNA-binding NarL/FixJ family response regulator
MKPFTEREKEVIKYVVKGYNNKKISSRMFTTVHTTKAHMTSLMRKLGVTNRTEAACKILRENLIELDDE